MNWNYDHNVCANTVNNNIKTMNHEQKYLYDAIIQEINKVFFY